MAARLGGAAQGEVLAVRTVRRKVWDPEAVGAAGSGRGAGARPRPARANSEEGGALYNCRHIFIEGFCWRQTDCVRTAEELCCLVFLWSVCTLCCWPVSGFVVVKLRSVS